MQNYDGPSRMVKRPTGSGGEPSSPNCGVSAGVKARQLTPSKPIKIKDLGKCFRPHRSSGLDGFESEQNPLVIVGQQVNQTVRPQAHIPDATYTVLQ